MVHNGIIENYVELKKHLIETGHTFKSPDRHGSPGPPHRRSLRRKRFAAVLCGRRLSRSRGSYAIGVLSAKDPTRFIAARKDSPLVLGIGDNEMFVASDVPAILQHTRKVIFLEDGDISELSQKEVKITDLEGRPIERRVQTIIWDSVMAEKGGYKHFMLKEIFEQVVTVRDTFRSRIDLETGHVELGEVLPLAAAKNLSKICLIGCGTSHHAALVARFWLEELGGILCDVEIASEFRYRRSKKEPGTLIVAITQSGETADTLAAMRDSKGKGLPTMALCNAVGSTATREADYTLMTHCGPEIGVASTKAFTGQLTALFLLALYIGQAKGSLPRTSADPSRWAFASPLAISEALAQAPRIEEVAKNLFRKTNFLYLGRHLNYPIALEGALKLKEISYIHAEGYPAGEMKHGPIALIDENLPVVAIATDSSVREKMLSNMQEVKARGGIVVAVAHDQDADVIKAIRFSPSVPVVLEALSPIITIIPLQLLAYYIAVLRGCDVDQPRNLAKSVTVE